MQFPETIDSPRLRLKRLRRQDSIPFTLLLDKESRSPAGNPVTPDDGHFCSVELDNFDSYNDIFGDNWPIQQGR